MSVVYLTAEEVLIIHSMIIDETSGLHGVRDNNLFLSSLERPKTSYSGNELYKSIFEKAGAILHSFAMYHVFMDGNKRTAFVATARFLYLNGYDFCGSAKETEEFMIKVVVDKLEIEYIANWLEKNSKKI